MIAANDTTRAGAGFGIDTNILTLITPDGERQLPQMTKYDAANALLAEILQRL